MNGNVTFSVVARRYDQVGNARQMYNNTEIQPFIHLEGKYKVGARFAGQLKKTIGIDIDLGSVEMFSLSADFNFNTGKWSGEVNYLAKDGKVIGSQGIGFSTPIGAIFGVPVGVGASGQVNYTFNTKTNQTSYDRSVDAGAGFGPVNVTGAYQVEKDNDNNQEKLTYKGTVGSSGAAGIIATGEYKVEMGTKITVTRKTDGDE